ncbi:MAG: bifunctional methionine sulfoxide reductase B/A protein [Bdellovibrionales bacterium]|nr:bifunctional methionine sulfoxide reductase B/A protein [Bdellovibrionales bacterium]
MKSLAFILPYLLTLYAISSYGGENHQPSIKGNKEVWMKSIDKSKLKEQLTDLQYKVTQKEGTEPPFENAYWDNKKEGIYVDVVSGEPLFSSKDKFDSGTGWPSFTKPLDDQYVKTKLDFKLIYPRREVRSHLADSHLGHVFKDGPQPTGLRYCINSAALEFIPKEKLKEKGYEKYLALFESSSPQSMDKKIDKQDPPLATQATETAILSGGCFWGVEEIIRKIPGVLKTDVGYTGGNISNATYDIVKLGTSGHAEAVRIEYDPSKTNYKTILDYFFRLHDPTTLNRQGNDVGTQYRSSVFYLNEEQKNIALEKIKEVNASKKWKNPLVTEVVPAGKFYLAEEYHQDYLQKHPNGYTCHYLRD